MFTGRLLLCGFLIAAYVAAAAALGPSAVRIEKSAGIRWWALGQEFDAESNAVRRLRSEASPSFGYLTARQKRMVLKNPGSDGAIAKSAKQALAECHYQFRNRRWNCSTSDTSHGGSLFGNLISLGCRETAFLHAVMNAALTYTLAESCSEGKIFTCSCAELEKRYSRKRRSVQEYFQHYSCSDNLIFAERFARKFSEAGDGSSDLHAFFMKHNSEAGLKHVVKATTQQCKCVGQSGSCALKTCWEKLVPLRDIGNALKQKFDGASKVVADNGRGSRDKSAASPHGVSNGFELSQNGNRQQAFGMSYRRFVPVHDSHKEPTALDLIYYDESPDFCVKNSRLGIRGTTGRRCNATSQDVDGCELMCCGRGHHSDIETIRDRCHCRFQWCCDVVCETCSRNQSRHVCR